MLNIGREQTLQDKLSTLNENIAEAQKGQAEGGFWNGLNARFSNLPEMLKQRDAIQSQITAEDTLNDILSDHDKAEQKRIKTQQEADRVNLQYLSNADKRNKVSSRVSS